MEKMPYYAITVRRYNVLFRHTEWFHQTQDLYNEILLFYYQLYLETFLDEQPGTQEALRILEKLTIVGRDKQPVPNPIPWKKVPLYFRRAAINTATAAAKSYLAREEQEQPTEAFTESVTFYKGMYRDFQQNTISLKLWDLVELKRELNKAVGYKGVQIVTISRPTAYGEYAPYCFVDTEKEFETLVKGLRS